MMAWGVYVEKYLASWVHGHQVRIFGPDLPGRNQTFFFSNCSTSV
ncbi:hypothetical protein B194_2058 [Serratia plymuthica A30]|nr:hypothetical protein B194_2058 [Serratia plymuthica A30]